MSARPDHLTLIRDLPDPLASAPVPDAPPAEVLAELDAAAARAGDLAARDRELHFEHGPDGRAVVEVRTLSGTVVKRITGSEALAVMAGLEDVE
jgi:hypothetical protein